MIQIIGLIVSAYCLIRLWQVPWEMSVVCGIDLKIPDGARWMIVAGASAFGVLTIGVLTVMLLMSGVDLPK